MRLRTRLHVATLLIVIVALIGAAGFRVLEGWSWFDGLYMTIVTMTTVGYREVHPLSPAGRVFNTFLIIAAVLSGGFLVATFTQAVLQFELRKIIGRRRMQRELTRTYDHYIICGGGRVGRTVAHDFKMRSVPCVVIELHADQAEWTDGENVPVIIGPAASEDVLKQAGVERARGLVSVVNSDAENLYIVLTARDLNPNLKIIARACEEEAIPKLLRAGASEVVSPYQFMAHRITQLLLNPNVLDFIDATFHDCAIDMRIQEVIVPERSSLAGRTLSNSDIRQKTGALLLALKQGSGRMLFNPGPDTVIHSGDRLIAIGSADHVNKLETLAAS